MLTEEQIYEIFVQSEKLKDLSFEDGIPYQVHEKMNDIANNIQYIVDYHIG